MPKIFGNLSGLKPSEKKRLEKLVTRRCAPGRWISVDLARELADAAWDLRRNLGVLMDRSGHVQRVLVGDMHGVPCPDLGAAPAPGRLQGLRLVRTELRNIVELPNSDREVLLRYRLDSVLRLLLDPDGDILWVTRNAIDPAKIEKEDGDPVHEAARKRLTALEASCLEELNALEEELGRLALGLQRAEGKEAALLVGIHEGNAVEAQARIMELAELARSALLDVAGTSFQKRTRPDPRTLLGKGKVQELAQLALRSSAKVLVLDRELTGAQQRNLEDASGLTVIDRTDLVLRIFERRAHTRASRVRVALARLRYDLPRLAVGGHGLSRIGHRASAFGGTRGKGERQIDMQRRRMRERIHRLEKILEKIQKQQATRRKRRQNASLSIVSLIGYTNAGKSTWLNALTEAKVLSEDLLFATLDTTVRRTRLPEGREVLFIDTVGFLRDLPEGLLDAFRSTLDELGQSSLLLHLVDLSQEDWKEKEQAVAETLRELGHEKIPRMIVYTKADLVDREELLPVVRSRHGGLVSAFEKEDRVRLRKEVEARLIAEEAELPSADRFAWAQSIPEDE